MSPTIEELELVCLDMAGTTVADEGLVLRAFEAALDALEVAPADRLAMVEVVVATMGLEDRGLPPALRRRGSSAAGQCSIRARLSRLVDEGGVTRSRRGTRMDALGFWGVKVALTTGFSAATADALLAALGWERRADCASAPTTRAAGGLPRHDPDRRPAAGVPMSPTSSLWAIRRATC